MRKDDIDYPSFWGRDGRYNVYKQAARIKFDYPLHLWRNDSNQRQAFPENSDILLKHWLFHQLWPFVLWNKI